MPSSTATKKTCHEMLCRLPCFKCFVLNTANCDGGNPKILMYLIEIKLDIVTERTGLKTDIQCSVKFRLLESKLMYTTVTIDQLKSDYADNLAYFTLEMINSYGKYSVNNNLLKNGSVTFPISGNFEVAFRSYAPHRTIVIKARFHPCKGFLMYSLPVVRLSDSVGYVTSPIRPVYSHDGEFHLNLTENQCVLIAFTLFVLEKDENCMSNYIQFTALMSNITWKKCGKQNLPLQVILSSVHLHFHSESKEESTGFKMMFALLSRSQEPQRLSGNLWNCSVPHFHLFQHLLNCNLERECQDGKDEQDCIYSSHGCEDGDIGAGTKCYKLFRQKYSTWNNAKEKCTQEGRSLVMLATIHEYKRFVEIVSMMKNVPLLYIGAHFVPRRLNLSLTATRIYKHVWKWLDGRTAFAFNRASSCYDCNCAMYKSDLKSPLIAARCNEDQIANFFCEYENPGAFALNKTISNTTQIRISVPLKEHTGKVKMVQCSARHVTRDFLPCDSQKVCRTTAFMTSCQMADEAVPMFLCKFRRSSLHYTLVCDHVDHCAGGLDEKSCYHPPCPSTARRCSNGQCISRNQSCDNKFDCIDQSDENRCQIPRLKATFDLSESLLPPAILYTDSSGRSKLKQMLVSEKCPDTHFQCPGGYCLPVYLFCNGIPDCAGLEDETACEHYVCPGLYRCHGIKICIHPDNVCDGEFQCPHFDDEMVCDVNCPDVCRCQGLAFICTARFSARSYSNLRFLDGSGTSLSPSDLIHNVYLIHLRLSKCRIKIFPTIELLNLLHLDLSWNHLEVIDMQAFIVLKNLKVLILSGNPLSMITTSGHPDRGMSKVQMINISHTNIKIYNGSALTGFSNLKMLDISDSKLSKITTEGFQSTVMLRTLDVRGSPLHSFPRDLLRKLTSLKTVFADNYILCCKRMLPDNFIQSNCHSEEDLVVSCKDLLKSNVYRVSLWGFATLSLVGNLGSFVGRLYLHTDGSGSSSFSVFVTCLSVADFLMGVYLTMVGVADLVYQGEYLWHHFRWKHSVTCSIAGFISATSSEVSAFLISVITLDRFLVLQFPFSNVHFKRQSALVACGIVWTIGIVLALIPLLPVLSSWEFYSQTGICIPLPFMNKDNFLGHTYSFTVIIILNFILFVLIAVGQTIIYFSIRSNTMKMTASKDATIARRLTTIAVSDFLCWFPVGLLGVLASTGTAVPDELNVVVVIFVLPLNSALNPFLYTFNVFMEKRLKAREAALMKRLENQAKNM